LRSSDVDDDDDDDDVDDDVCWCLVAALMEQFVFGS